MGSRNARRQRQAGKGQVRNVGCRVGGIYGDVSVAAPWRESEILRAADVARATSSREGEDAAIVRLTFIFEGQGALEIAGAVRWPIQGLVPAPQVHTSGDPADRDHVDAALRVHAVARLDALNNERQRAQPCRNGRELRQAQVLVPAESARPRTHKRRDGSRGGTVLFVCGGLGEARSNCKPETTSAANPGR